MKKCVSVNNVAYKLFGKGDTLYHQRKVVVTRPYTLHLEGVALHLVIEDEVAPIGTRAKNVALALPVILLFDLFERKSLLEQVEVTHPCVGVGAFHLYAAGERPCFRPYKAIGAVAVVG